MEFEVEIINSIPYKIPKANANALTKINAQIQFAEYPFSNPNIDILIVSEYYEFVFLDQKYF